MIRNILKRITSLSLLLAFSILLTAASSYCSALEERVGIIEGLVISEDIDRVDTAKVTVWQCIYNGDTGAYKNIKIAEIDMNPQFTGPGRKGEKGSFTFENVPSGLYNITAEKNGHMGYKIINFDARRLFENTYIVITGYNTSTYVAHVHEEGPVTTFQVDSRTSTLVAIGLIIMISYFNNRKKRA
ncbi:hypothetical protein CUJ83_01655 [Methanocella sp. CWC-04]|uniref:Carboxypeptidase regulatory-like domain-containing protein n=1 Tax=Methanooceanicella nereidis TaxID=2052831 RepID=A0AAP2W400_9EURY|nr:hypothetical protein [Methanocella sp. CWC-04]MCD1293700.1 hypothetical protein [Methanocella sp. CWC-04]